MVGAGGATFERSFGMGRTATLGFGDPLLYGFLGGRLCAFA